MRLNVSFLFLFGCGLLIMSSCDNGKDISDPSDSYFLKYYGGDGNQEAVDMIVNTDGTIILLGKSTSGDKRIFLLKADTKGNVIWQYNYGGITDVAKDIETTVDGNYIILSDYLGSADNIDIKLTQIDQAGVVQKTTVYGSAYNDNSHALTPLSDGGFIVVGYADFDWEPSTSIGFERISSIFHYRCDKNFNFYDESRWKNFYGSGKSNFAVKVFLLPGSGFYVYGCTDAMHDNKLNGKVNLFYYKLDDFGNNSSGPTFIGGSNADLVINSVVEIPSVLLSGNLCVGFSTDNAGNSKVHVIKLKYPLQFNATNDNQFDQNILSTRKMQGICATPSLTAPPGYLIVADEKDETNQSNIVLTKINQEGNEMWSTSFGGSKNDNAAAVAELPNGKILVFGTVQLDIQLKMALIKVNSRGQFLN